MEAARDAWRRVGELFVEKALITGPELEQALAVQAASGRPLGEVFVGQGLISSPEMTEVIMEQVGRKVAKEQVVGSAVWTAIRRRRSRTPEHRFTTKSESPDELTRRISQMARHLTDTQLALEQEHVACELARAAAAAAHEELGAAEKRIGELAEIVYRLQAQRSERSGAGGKWRETIRRALVGNGLRLAQE